MEDRTFAVEPDEHGEFWTTIVDYKAEKLLPTEDRVMLTETRKVRVSEGQVYRVPEGTPHETSILKLPTATLLVARESGKTRTPIFNRQAIRCVREATRQDVRAHDAVAELRAAFALL
jgi:hypothetical protein